MVGSAVSNGKKPEVLQVSDLRVYFDTPRGSVRAVDGVTFYLRAEERLGLVGESGSGKTTMALALMRMIKSPGRIASGSIQLDGNDLLKLNDTEMQSMRLSEIAMVAQGSMNSLNPVYRIRDQFVDAFADHGMKMTNREVDDRIASLLQQVGLKPDVSKMFPHELSGGMKQRVCIAIAICLQPKVILADEPTSALDVVVQRQVMETLRRVQSDIGAAVILVGHDMGLMAQFVDRLGVMYAGRLVEVSPVHDIFSKPSHPYTQLLISSLPSLDGKGEFKGIPGLPPSLLDLPEGCSFHPRCPFATDRCRKEEPAMREIRPEIFAACHLL
jgi:oligopeptide/dipeptide ABC transporter ATP-binding protein